MIVLRQFWSGNYKKYITGVMTAVSVFLCVKYILPLVMPFFIALCLISVMKPLLRNLECRLHIGKSTLRDYCSPMVYGYGFVGAGSDHGKKY